MVFNWITDAASSRVGKWVVLAAWVLATVLIVPLAPTLSDITTNDPLQFLPGDAESTRAAELERDRYPSATTPAIIVVRNDDGLTEQDFAAASEINDQIVAMIDEPDSNVDSVVSIYTIPQAESELVSVDGTTMTMIVNISGSSNESPYLDRIDAIREVTGPVDSAELQVKVSGPGGLVADLVSVFANIDGFLLIVTVVLVLTLLIIIYRSPVVAFVPILIVGLVFQLSGGIAAAVLEAIDFPVNGQATGIMTVILFGAGTDYILFISSRYREELARTEDKHEAMRRSMRALSGAIASAGGTLMVASLILLLADLGSYRSLGPVIAIAIGVMTLAALTLVPAVLAALGRFAFWPFRPQYDADAPAEQQFSPVWSRVARFVLHRPGTILIATTAVLLVMASGTALLNPSYDSLESLPQDEESVQGFELLRQSFPEGQLSPTNVYVTFPAGESVFDPDNLQLVHQLSEEIAGIDGVASVSAPSDPFGVNAGPGPDAVLMAYETVPPEAREGINQARISGETSGPPPGVDASPPDAEAFGLYSSSLGFLSSDLEIARIEVVLDENPYSNEAMDLMPQIRDVSDAAAGAAGLPAGSVLVGGETAENYDTRAANVRDSLVVLPMVLLAIMIILGVLLRSVVAALFLGGTIVITYFATLGLSLFFFVVVLGQESIGNGVPFLLFVFLNALGVDYSIYLMSRVREEAATYEMASATERALARTGGVITSAGLILAGTFAALMTLPLRDLFQLGFAVAIGVLMDTFITRSLLVPSIVEMLGDRTWWPSGSAGGTKVAEIGEEELAVETD